MEKNENALMCPYCGKEMVSGFVQSARRIYFSPEKHGAMLIPQEGKDILLSQHNLMMPTVQAAYCPKCHKVILEPEK